MTIEMNGEGTLATVTLDGATYPLVLREKEALVRDTDLAAWLNFSRPRDFRKLVERHATSGNISPIEQRDTVSRCSRAGRAMGSIELTTYLLTQSDALFIATQAKTAKSVEVTKTIIAVFLAWQRGQLRTAVSIEHERLPSGHTALRVVVEDATMRQLEAAAKRSGMRPVDTARWLLRAWSCQRFAEYGVSESPDVMADLRELGERRSAEALAALGGAANEKPFHRR